MRLVSVSTVLALAISLASGSVSAEEDLTPREARMMALIESLEQRVERLEDELADRDAAQAEPGAAGNAAVDAPDSAGADPDPDDFRVYWDSGLRMATRDGRVKLRLGGQIHNDWQWFDDGSDFDIVFGDVEDGVDLRRLRAYISGQVVEDFEFKLQFDFAGGDADVMDACIAYTGAPRIGRLQAGLFKEPFSLEELLSSNNTPFLERAMPNVFVPSRNVGVQLSNSHFDDRLTWAAGVFRDADTYGNGASDGDYAVTARVTGLPWYTQEGRGLLHTGVGYSHRKVDDTLRYQGRPEAVNTPRYLDTGALAADGVDLFNAELALRWDRFLLQGEYFLADVDTPHFDDARFDGYYVLGSVFLTPDRRSYNKSAGVFGGVKPARNFSLRGAESGPGAWEIAARYSTLDLNDDWIIGGEGDNWTLGLNWYLNPHVRLMLNYTHADVDRFPLYSGNIESFQARFQIAF